MYRLRPATSDALARPETARRRSASAGVRPGLEIGRQHVAITLAVRRGRLRKFKSSGDWAGKRTEGSQQEQRQNRSNNGAEHGIEASGIEAWFATNLALLIPSGQAISGRS